MRMKLTAVLTVSCILLCGCAAQKGPESSGGLFAAIEPAQESVEQAKYEDGTYVSQTVHEPVPDPYADDTTLKKNGETAGGIRYALYQKHAEITGHTNKFDAEEIEIPDTLDGLPVTKITSVENAEDSIFDIDRNGGFYCCYSLRTSGTMPSTAAAISARLNCRKALQGSGAAPLQCAAVCKS